MGKYLYMAACCLFFGVGAYVWKVKNTGYKHAREAEPAAAAPEMTSNAILVEVAGEPVTGDDVDWEYQLLTDGIFDKESLTPIPDLGDRYDAELAPLKKQIVASILERKLLYAFVQQDKKFDLNDPARYTACLTEWQEITRREDVTLLKSRKDRERLKSRLCERSILSQYLKEMLFPTVTVSAQEMQAYYVEHPAEFKKPERVEVRKIVLADEREAKRARYRVTRDIFARMPRELSIAAEAVDGGKLGPFAKGEMPSVFEVAFHMRRGEISAIQKSTYGFHIIMLLDKHPPAELSLEEAKESIAAILRKKKEDAEYQKWVER